MYNVLTEDHKQYIRLETKYHALGGRQSTVHWLEDNNWITIVPRINWNTIVPCINWITIVPHINWITIRQFYKMLGILSITKKENQPIRATLYYCDVAYFFTWIFIIGLQFCFSFPVEI